MGTMPHQESLVTYNKMYSRAKEPTDMASAARNIAVTSLKIAKHLMKASNKDKGRQLIIYHFKETVIHFDKAKSHGSGCMPEEWHNSLLTSFMVCLLDLKNFIWKEDDYEKRISEFDMFKNLINYWSEYKADLCIDITTQLFRLGVTVLQKGDFKKALHWMKECYRPLEEARQVAGEQDLLIELDILQEDIHIHQCMAESLQSRATGDKLLETALTEYEELSMTAIYEVIDWYKRAILLAREKEIEMEAVALSRLGRVYADILKVKEKAKDYFTRSIQLAHSLHPRTFNNDEWFQTATAFVEKYQKEKQDQETKKWQEERKKYLDELKDETALIDKMRAERERNVHLDAKGDLMFLQFLYKTHRPNKQYQLLHDERTESIDRAKVKRLYQTALYHYNPAHIKQLGRKFETLYEEITKHLTSIYENLK